MSHDLEEEYFAKEDREKIAQLKKRWQAEATSKALKERRDLHFNKCGKCGASMDPVAFRGLEIEVCPECGAVLLDQGELQVLAGTDQGSIMTGLFSIFHKS